MPAESWAAPFAPTFARWLDAPGPPFAPASPVRLGAVFVAPPLRTSGSAGARRADRTINDAEAFLLAADRLVVSGPRRIGRTTLAKWAVRAAHAQGETPVYACADAFDTSAPEALVARLRALAAEQYGADVAPNVLVLDDLHRARLGAGDVRAELLRVLDAVPGRVIAFATEHGLAERVNAGAAVRYARASIGSLDAERRAELAARFVGAVAPVERWRAFVGPTRRLIENLFGTGRLPSFPYYVLAALGELYTGSAASFDDTGYGPYYAVTVHEAARAARAYQRR